MRFLIIVFAVAMVAIGMYPFRREFRAQFQQVRAVVRRELGDYLPNGARGDRAAEARGSLHRPQPAGRGDADREVAEERRPGDRSRGRAAAPFAGRPESPAVERAEPAKSLDRLSEDDRRALDQLLNR